MESSLSLEETNKLRLSLGLRPIVDDGRDAVERREEVKVEEKEVEVDRAASTVYRRLEGETLGGGKDEVEESTEEWLKRQRARKRVKRDGGSGNVQATTRKDPPPLPGSRSRSPSPSLRVAHDYDDLDGEHILTLKDQAVLADDDDALIDTSLVEQRATEKRLALKKKQPGYNPYEESGLLSKYDEELEPSFVLGGGVPEKRPKKVKMDRAEEEQGPIRLVEDRETTSDFMTYEEAGIRRPKRKKKLSTRQRVPDGEDETNAQAGLPAAAPMAAPLAAKKDVSTANLIDDDDLGRALALQRKRANKVKKVTAEDLARQVALERQTRSHAMDLGESAGDEKDDGLIFDETSEFIRKIDQVAKRGNEREGESSARLAPSVQAETAPLTPPIKEESPVAMSVDVSGTEDRLSPPPRRSITPELGTAGEIIQSRGLTNTLSLLRQQGRLPAPTTEQRAIDEQQKRQNDWLADKKLQEHLRQLEVAKTKGQHRDHAQWEFEKRVREQEDIQDALNRYQSYKPDVKIAYYDDFGRELNLKEAWKALSHKFHGRASGKAKEEKRLQRIEEQRLTELATNRSGVGDAFEKAQQQSGNAHVVLSRGSKK